MRLAQQILFSSVLALAACGGSSTSQEATDAAGAKLIDAAGANPLDASANPLDAASLQGFDAGAAFDAAQPDASAPADASLPDAAAIAADAAMQIFPATSGTIDLSFEVDATGQGTQRLGSISVVKDVSDYQFNGVQHSGFTYQNHPPFDGYLLYDVVSIAQDGSDLAVSYLYCLNGVLDSVYSESILDAMADEGATGTCAGQTQTTHVAVDMPALAITPQAMDTGITITGTTLSLGANGGTVTLGGKEYSVVPFNTVDCSSCPGGSWYEIHTILMAPEEGCFAILYLMLGQTSTVDLEYAICLPSLGRPADTKFSSTWSGTLQTRPPPPPPAPTSVRRAPKFRPLPRSLLDQH